MCVAIPTPFRELATLASKIARSLKDSMNHFVDLTSAQQCPEMQPQPSRENNPEHFGSGKPGFVDGVPGQHTGLPSN